MIDQPLEKSLIRRAELRAQIQHLSQDIDRLRRMSSDLRHELGYIEGIIDAGYREMARFAKYQQGIRTEVVKPDSGKIATQLANPDRQDVVTAALTYIADARRPLSRKRIHEKLTENGTEIRGKDPLMVLSTMLWRTKDRIIRLPGFGYWPVDRPYPRADYFPEGANQLKLKLPKKAK